MGRKRNKLEIIRDILRVIREKSGRIKPTHILYKSNLSHQMMEDYLADLKIKQFITEEQQGRSRTYSITDKGIQYLDKYAMITEFTSAFGLGDD